MRLSMRAKINVTGAVPTFRGVSSACPKLEFGVSPRGRKGAFIPQAFCNFPTGANI